MLEGLRTCPECKTRVLPTADYTCPACRRHSFDVTQPEVTAGASVVGDQKTQSPPGLMRRALSFRGRLNRWDFMRVMLFVQVANLGFYLLNRPTSLEALDDELAADPIAGLLLVLFLLGGVVFVVALALMSVVQRLHDLNRTGLWAFLLFVPLLNLVLLVILLVRPGVPLETEEWG